jgi:hypothetical protein
MKNVSQSLLSLGEAKLAIQAATSIGYDSQALGLMAVAVALIAVDVALMGGLGRAWWLPLIGLGASLLISVAAISQPEIDTGQDITLALRMDATDAQTCACAAGAGVALGQCAVLRLRLPSAPQRACRA